MEEDTEQQVKSRSLFDALNSAIKRLQRIVTAMRDHSNKEIEKMTKAINELADKFEPQEEEEK